MRCSRPSCRERPAGESRTLESDPIACAVAGVDQYTIEAQTENGSPARASLGTSQCSVECKSQPGVSDVRCEVPARSAPRARATRSRARPRTATAGRQPDPHDQERRGRGAQDPAVRELPRVRSDAGEATHRLCGGGRQPVHDRGPDRERLWQERAWDLAVLVERKTSRASATSAARCRLRLHRPELHGQGLGQELQRPGGQPDPHDQERRGCGAQDPAVRERAGG